MHAKDPGDKLVCLASMAAALSPKRKNEAMPLLRESFGGSPSESSSRRESGNLPLALVPLAAVVAPDDADDFFWQALTVPGPQHLRSHSAYSMGERHGAIGMAALLAQRIDAEVAAALAEPLRKEMSVLFDRLGQSDSTSESEISVFAALLATSPEMAENVLKRWPAPVGTGPQVHSDYLRYSVAAILFRSPQARNDQLIQRFLNQWFIDKEDL